MLKYLKKYGGVSFDEQPLNDVDRLVFAQMAYVDFPADARRDVPLSEILGQITFEKKEAAAEVRFWFQSKSDRELCALAAAAKRYADVRFHGFFRNTDADAPFAALSLLLPDGAQLIAFRGTDNTLKGWKEDFDLAVETEIPTQGTAKKFVEAAAQEERLLGIPRAGTLRCTRPCSRARRRRNSFGRRSALTVRACRRRLCARWNTGRLRTSCGSSCRRRRW